MRTLSKDTAPEAERVLIDGLRRMPPLRKVEMVGSLNRTARKLAVLGLRNRYPHASDEETRRRLADLLLGPSLAAKVYGPSPDE